MATDAQSLLSAANCYLCYGGGKGTLDLIKLGLLRQILLANNSMADTSPQALLAAANCYACYAPSPGLMKLLELGLLAQIVNAGGASGLSGNGPPTITYPAGPPNGKAGTSYMDLLTYAIYWWSGTAWIP